MPSEEEFCKFAKQELSYDAWGRLRNSSTQAAYAVGSEPALFLSRGYTGHEHLPWFGLINMNARLYDPVLGRFLSPDPYVQNPFMTQNFNRYSYVLNNPLVYIDQDGELIGWIIGGLLIGAYIGASKKGGSWNPAKWEGNWWQGALWGAGIGALTGGIAGSIWAAGGTINFGISIFGKEIPALVLTKAGAKTGGLVTLGIGGTTTATSIVTYTIGKKKEKASEIIKKIWNSDPARIIIPDVIYANGSGSLAFIGGGGADIGFALPLRGEDAGKLYLTSTLKGKMGGHLGVGINIGSSNYLGKVKDFDFDTSFKGYSSGIEADLKVLGASLTISNPDKRGNYLISKDVGVGPGIGASVNIGSDTHGIPIFKFW